MFKNLTAGMNALLQDDYDELSIKSASSHTSRTGTLNRSGTGALESSTRSAQTSTPEPKSATRTPPTRYSIISVLACVIHDICLVGNSVRADWKS